MKKLSDFKYLVDPGWGRGRAWWAGQHLGWAGRGGCAKVQHWHSHIYQSLLFCNNLTVCPLLLWPSIVIIQMSLVCFMNCKQLKFWHDDCSSNLYWPACQVCQHPMWRGRERSWSYLGCLITNLRLLYHIDSRISPMDKLMDIGHADGHDDGYVDGHVELIWWSLQWHFVRWRRRRRRRGLHWKPAKAFPNKTIAYFSKLQLEHRPT